MHVHMHTYTRAGGFSEIQPHIDSLGPAHLSENPAGKLNNGHEFSSFFG